MWAWEALRSKKMKASGMVELSLEQAFIRAEYSMLKEERSQRLESFIKQFYLQCPIMKGATALTALQEEQSSTNTQSPPQEVITQLANLIQFRAI